ncbi:MAG: hypothetical protein Kow0010_12530 [Dehalococcoidia bacterium]
MGMFGLSRARIVVVACLLVAAFFTYSAVAGAVRNHQLAQSRAEAIREIQVLEDEKAYLEAVRDYVASDTYVEQQARRQLGYIREGEVPFVVIGPGVDDEQDNGERWWQRLFPR